MKHYLEYNPQTGETFDGNGQIVAGGLPFPGLYSIKADSLEGSKSKVEDIAKLKSAGFEADEIMQMIREGLI